MEQALRGQGPDRAALLHRFPGHREEVEALLSEVFANGRRPKDAEAGTRAGSVEEAPPAETLEEPRPEGRAAVAAEGEPDVRGSDVGEPPPTSGGEATAGAPALTVVRDGRHGTLLRQPDGRLRYHLPAARLASWGPASLYLARVERLARTSVPGVQTPTLLPAPDGSMSVIFPESPPAVVRLAASRSRHRGATHHALCLVRRAALRLARLHAQGAAHGRLTREHLRGDGAAGTLVLDMGLADGPGRDGDDDLASQKLADVQALGALLYGALELSGREPDVREIVARHEAGKLPYLASRRPRLLPALERTVERALSAGDWGDAGYASVEELVESLEALLDMEAESPPVTRSPATGSRWRHRDWMPYAVIGVLIILLILRAWLL